MKNANQGGQFRAITLQRWIEAVAGFNTAGGAVVGLLVGSHDSNKAGKSRPGQGQNCKDQVHKGRAERVKNCCILVLILGARGLRGAGRTTRWHPPQQTLPISLQTDLPTTSE